MPRILWDHATEKTYEVGVSNGVLYPSGSSGVAWPGLIQMQLRRVGANVTPIYFDGRKVQTSVERGDFEATLTAFSAPAQFSMSEGLVAIKPGLYATHQPREPFGLCYKSLIGNDERGTDYGYKLHFIYGAYAFPDTRVYSTEDDQFAPVVRTWRIQSIPYHKRNYIWFRSETGTLLQRQKSAYFPVSYMVVSSRSVHPDRLSYLEDVIYGTDTTEPELPTPPELIEIVRAI